MMLNRNSMNKKNILLPVFLVIMVISGYAQKFPYDQYVKSNTTYLGLDYTYARFINRAAFTDQQAIKDKFIWQWNHMLDLEPEKYDFNKFTENSKSDIFLDIMDERNKTIDPAVLIQDEYYDINMKDIPAIVDEINFGDLKGLASFFLVGTYNKNALMATYYFVLYDIDAGTILFTKKYSTKPGGFGLRNYWARTYYNVLLSLENDWKNEWSAGK